ncbi:hypothetical protein YDYSY3_22430 [Paenibacillus chitinolyticus]|nr:hypothetical protein YDYSY3_22430 [Paenibacillus chitinolyticus]
MPGEDIGKEESCRENSHRNVKDDFLNPSALFVEQTEISGKP